ncbi:uncharacterized protein LOC123311851 [Coccinella septempunctata]|uniref:uncharacterized protein LOC123311851 n=1 Tax=Coccinella septempunctata TaxID=41139 RepID=UPI001D07A68A|nr:uncharacterized protein LOC123311851 [Coccinella septempunctata]
MSNQQIAGSKEKINSQSKEELKTEEHQVPKLKDTPLTEAAPKTEGPKAMWWKKKPPSPKLPCEILTPNDSRDPSYTDLTLPYRVICRQRYQRCAKKYRKQFITEIKRQEAMQFRALDGIRIRREFCDPLIEPLPPKDRIKLTPKQQYRLDELLKTNIK